MEFSGYECPFCRRAHASLDSAARAAGNVAVIYRHLPLPTHPQADMAARASVCSEKPGRFTAMHRHLFETDEWRQNPDWGKEALAVGITDTTSFRACLSDTATSRRLAEDRLFATRLGIHATPTFVAPGGTHVGVATGEDFLHILNKS